MRISFSPPILILLLSFAPLIYCGCRNEPIAQDQVEQLSNSAVANSLVADSAESSSAVADSPADNDSGSGTETVPQIDLDSEIDSEVKDESIVGNGPQMNATKTVTIGGIDWYTQYDLAMEIAQRDGKPIWLHFGENPG